MDQLKRYFYHEPKETVIQMNGRYQMNIIKIRFDFSILESIRRKCCYLIDLKKKDIKLDMNLECYCINDPGFMILFEMLIGFLIQEKPDIDIQLRFQYNSKQPTNVCIRKSILIHYNDKKINNKEFMENLFHENGFTYKTSDNYIKKKKTNPMDIDDWVDKIYFRKIVRNDVMSPSILSSDLRTFFRTVNCSKNFNLDSKQSNRIITAISELVSNVVEHTESKAIVYCAVDNAYYQKKSDCYTAAFCVLNLSEKKFYTDMLNFIKQNKGKVKLKVFEVLKNHEHKFSEKYTLEHFCMVSNFQNNVIKENNEYDRTGGTGLPKFIKDIEEFINQECCYVASGKNMLYLISKLTRFENNEVGFNADCNYCTDAPADCVTEVIPFDVSGTVFSMILILNREEKENV